MTTGMQSSDTATGVRVNYLCHILVRSGMLETNKQVLILKFGEDLSYFVILRYKLRDLIKMYDDYVNGPVKEDFQKTFSYYFISPFHSYAYVRYKYLSIMDFAYLS